MLPVAGGLADLLGQLALRALERALALLVELAGGQLEQVGVADRLARLAHEPDVLAVVGDDRHRAGMRDPLARDLLAVLVAERALVDVDDGALEDGARLQALEAELMGRRHAGRLVEQRQADVEHPLQRGDADPLGRLVVVLGAVGEVDALDALEGERVGVRAAAGDDPDAARSRTRAARPRRRRPPARSPFWR